jgi:thiamine kinase-like enzyme
MTEINDDDELINKLDKDILFKFIPDSIGIQSYNIEIIGKNNGHRSVCYRIFNIQYYNKENESDVKLPNSFIIKKSNQEEFKELCNNELNFYNNIANQITSIKLPKCYFTSVVEITDVEKNENKIEYTLIFEDLSTKFQIVDFWIEMKDYQLLCGVKTLALFHSECYKKLKNNELNIKNLKSMNEFNNFWLNRYEDSHNRLLNYESENEKIFSERFHEFIEKYNKVKKEIIKYKSKLITIIHYDAFKGNWLFNEQSACLIDWQTVVIGLGTIDLSTLIFGSGCNLDIKEKSKKLYYYTLEIENYTKEDFKTDYIYGQLMSFLQLSSMLFGIHKRKKTFINEDNKRIDTFKYYSNIINKFENEYFEFINQKY